MSQSNHVSSGIRVARTVLLLLLYPSRYIPIFHLYRAKLVANISLLRTESTSFPRPCNGLLYEPSSPVWSLPTSIMSGISPGLSKSTNQLACYRPLGHDLHLILCTTFNVWLDSKEQNPASPAACICTDVKVAHLTLDVSYVAIAGIVNVCESSYPFVLHWDKINADMVISSLSWEGRTNVGHSEAGSVE